MDEKIKMADQFENKGGGGTERGAHITWLDNRDPNSNLNKNDSKFADKSKISSTKSSILEGSSAISHDQANSNASEDDDASPDKSEND